MLRLIVLTALVIPAFAQTGDVSILAGGGVSFGDDQDSVGVAAAGASVGFPHSSTRRFQLDYLYQNVRFDLPHNRHFFTGSYVIQRRAGGSRPFFQIGAGFVHRRFHTVRFFPDEIVRREETDTSLAVVFGGGAIVDVGKGFFVRPELRLYGHVGPTLTVLPGVAVGRRF